MEPTYRIYVCHGSTCGQHVRPVWQALNQAIEVHGLADRCTPMVSGCLARCERGPNINVYPGLTKYAGVTVDGTRRIVAEHLAKGVPVADLIDVPEWA